MAMILYLGTPTQVTTATSEIEGSIIDALFSSHGDIERGTMEEEVVDTRIYSVLILLKLAPAAGLDVEKIEGLIVQTEEEIWNPPAGDLGPSEADIGVDLGREIWKAIYLSALLFRFLPDIKREERVERLRTRVRELLDNGGLMFMSDYRCCLKPLYMDVSPTSDQRRQTDTVFEGWIGGFPLFQLARTVSERLLGQMRNPPSLLNPRRWFG